MGDGLVEHMNQSLLALLCTYIEREVDWEQHLLFPMSFYHTTRHSFTGLSSFEDRSILAWLQTQLSWHLPAPLILLVSVEDEKRHHQDQL